MIETFEIHPGIWYRHGHVSTPALLARLQDLAGSAAMCSSTDSPCSRRAESSQF